MMIKFIKSKTGGYEIIHNKSPVEKLKEKDKTNGIKYNNYDSLKDNTKGLIDTIEKRMKEIGL